MINVRKTVRSTTKTSEINISPLIDLVFLLLIFFMVTTSFVKEAGIDVSRPMAKTATVKEKSGIYIGVSRSGLIFFEKKRIDIRSVRSHVERSLAENPESGVVIVADKESGTGIVVRIIDQCRLAGTENVSIATRRGDEEDV